jgi:hypothetical protein
VRVLQLGAHGAVAEDADLASGLSGAVERGEHVEAARAYQHDRRGEVALQVRAGGAGADEDVHGIGALERLGVLERIGEGAIDDLDLGQVAVLRHHLADLAREPARASP